ncbi:MAG: hypothetical protein ACR2KT_08700, partial [Methylocella sp.]
IEAQLAHVEANAVRKAYARAEYWAERVAMMAYWADRLDELRRTAPSQGNGYAETKVFIACRDNNGAPRKIFA